jgi:hypothetical protein
VRFEGNDGGTAGGALSIEGSAFEVTNSVFVGNSSAVGNAIYASDFSTSADLSPGIVRNSTVIGEGEGSGIETDSPLEVVNSIVRGYGTGIAYSGPPGGLVASHNAFWENGADVSADGYALDPSNLRVDPKLDAEQRLLPGSPLIDAGRRTPGPFADLDGDARPAAGPSGRFAFDIGADEAPGEAQRVFRTDRGEYDLAIAGPAEAGALGEALLAGDWSGDGRDDLLLLARGAGRAFGLPSFAARLFGPLELRPELPGYLEIRSQPERALDALAGGDLDGDGRGDVALGSLPLVHALSGGAGLVGTHGVPGSGPPASPGTRGALAIGDLSGDGIGDLVIGDPASDDGAAEDAGAVRVLLGHPGFEATWDLAAGPTDVVIHGPAVGAALGTALALADLDTDGDLDLAAGDSAHVHVLLGPLAPGARRLALAPADARIAWPGLRALAAIDPTGEGRFDLAGASDSLRLVRGPFTAGQQLSASGPRSLEWTSEEPLSSLAVGDVLGDARAELIAGSAGSTWVLSGGVGAAGSVPLDELAPLAISGAGAAVGAADLDGDGRRDLIASAPPAGRAYLVYGGIAVDNCPGIPNPGQADADLDGNGDACQCGDASGDGRADGSDLGAIRGALAGAALPDAPQKCSVRGPVDASPAAATGLRADCSLVDAAVLARQLAGLGPGVAQACGPALGLP